VVAVFTQPDRATGRGQKILPNEIKAWALGHSLPVYQPEKLGDDERAQLAALAPDLTLVMAYGHILRDAFIATPRLGTLNLHTSILPKYRGASPIQTAIACGETRTGVSLMRIVRELDAGPVADVEHVPIAPLDTARVVEEKLAAASVALVARALPRLISGELAFIEQNHGLATFCRRLTKADGTLDFTVSAAELAARINGLFPWPACSVEIDGQPIKLGQADALIASQGPMAIDGAAPGTVVGTDASGVLARTGEGVLRLRQLQRPGGRMLSAAEFLRGFPIAAGTVLPSRPMPALVSAEKFR
jgi:methionyl-tRNA formyltransferase